MTIESASTNPLSTLAAFIGKSSETVRLSVTKEDNFHIGELIKARVLRQVSENCYAMQLKSGVREADSAIPFRSGDTLYGRIVGLGSQIEVERIRLEKGKVEHTRSKIPTELDRQRALAFAQRSQRPFSGKEIQIIKAFKGNAEQIYLATLAGLALRNLRVGVSTAGVQVILSAMTAKTGHGVFPPVLEESPIPIVEESEIQNHRFEIQNQALGLARIIKQLVETIPEENHCANKGGMNADSEKNSTPARRILNLESGSSVGHRINTIPLLINEQLIELDIALFSEHSEDTLNAITEKRYGSVVLSLTSPRLGRMEFRIATHDGNIVFALTAERGDVIEAFASRALTLKTELERINWKVGEMTYKPVSGKSQTAGHAVLWHLANLDRYQIYT